MVGHTSTYFNIATSQLLAPLNRTASAVSASFDLQNYNDVALAVSVGATGDTLSGANRVEVSVQESSDNVNFTPVSDSDLVHVVPAGTAQATGTFAVLNAPGAVNQVYETGYRGNLRYIRVALTNYGTTSVGTAMDVLALGGRPRTSPVNF